MATRQTSLSVSLPEAMREWVEERVSAQGYGTVSEYFMELVREDQKRKAREALDRKLIGAIDSGEATEMTAGDWQYIRSKVRENLAAKKAGT